MENNENDMNKKSNTNETTNKPENDLLINTIIEEEDKNKKTNNPEQNKLDWKEIEKWNNIKEAERENEYGVDITKLGKNNKKIDIFAKILDITIKTLYIIGKGAVILAIILGLLWVINTFTSAPEMIKEMKKVFDIK